MAGAAGLDRVGLAPGGTLAPTVPPAASAGVTASPAITPPALLTGYRWPLDHARITSAFGPSNLGVVLVDGVRFHDGIDIANFCGDQIEAAHDGVVLAAGRHVEQWVGWVGDLDAYLARLDAKDLWSKRAIVVVIDDGNGYRSVYMHFSRVVVKAGQHVTAGELIGYEGATGYATGCHLHYAIFSPDETRLFETRPDLVQSQALPAAEIARIDPLLVLPPPESADVTWGWGARPAASGE
jgi:murein DD-endopeptidase MepM/ murein hydrolase activator NlpD